MTTISAIELARLARAMQSAPPAAEGEGVDADPQTQAHARLGSEAKRLVLGEGDRMQTAIESTTRKKAPGTGAMPTEADREERDYLQKRERPFGEGEALAVARTVGNIAKVPYTARDVGGAMADQLGQRMVKKAPGGVVGAIQKGVGHALEWAGESIRSPSLLDSVAKPVIDAAAALPKSQSAEGFQPGKLKWWTENLAEQLPYIAMTVATGGAASFAGLGARSSVLIATIPTMGIEAQESFDTVAKELEAGGMSHDQALVAAAPYAVSVGAVNGALESIPAAQYLFDTPIGKALKRRMASAVMKKLSTVGADAAAEAVTEATQELTQMVGQYAATGDLGAFDNGLTRMAAAGTLGGAGGAVTGLVMSPAEQAAHSEQSRSATDTARAAVDSSTQSAGQNPSPAATESKPASDATAQSEADVSATPSESIASSDAGDPAASIGPDGAPMSSEDEASAAGQGIEESNTSGDHTLPGLSPELQAVVDKAMGAAKQALEKDNGVLDRSNAQGGVSAEGAQGQAPAQAEAPKAKKPASIEMRGSVGMSQAHQAAQDRIDGDDLTVGGFETRPHVTVAFGADESHAPEIRKIIESTPPIEVTTGDMGVFENRRPARVGGDADVLHITMQDNSALAELNQKLRALVGDGGHADFRPHMTVGYLKPGTGRKYLDTPVAGRKGTMEFVDVMFDGKPERIFFKGAKRAISADAATAAVQGHETHEPSVFTPAPSGFKDYAVLSEEAPAFPEHVKVIQSQRVLPDTGRLLGHYDKPDAGERNLAMLGKINRPMHISRVRVKDDQPFDTDAGEVSENVEAWFGTPQPKRVMSETNRVHHYIMDKVRGAGLEISPIGGAMAGTQLPTKDDDLDYTITVDDSDMPTMQALHEAAARLAKIPGFKLDLSKPDPTVNTHKAYTGWRQYDNGGATFIKFEYDWIGVEPTTGKRKPGKADLVLLPLSMVHRDVNASHALRTLPEALRKWQFAVKESGNAKLEAIPNSRKFEADGKTYTPEYKAAKDAYTDAKKQANKPGLYFYNAQQSQDWRGGYTRPRTELNVPIDPKRRERLMSRFDGDNRILASMLDTLPTAGAMVKLLTTRPKYLPEKLAQRREQTAHGSAQAIAAVKAATASLTQAGEQVWGDASPTHPIIAVSDITQVRSVVEVLQRGHGGAIPTQAINNMKLRRFSGNRAVRVFLPDGGAVDVMLAENYMAARSGLLNAVLANTRISRVATRTIYGEAFDAARSRSRMRVSNALLDSSVPSDSAPKSSNKAGGVTSKRTATSSPSAVSQPPTVATKAPPIVSTNSEPTGSLSKASEAASAAKSGGVVGDGVGMAGIVPPEVQEGSDNPDPLDLFSGFPEVYTPRPLAGQPIEDEPQAPPERITANEETPDAPVPPAVQPNADDGKRSKPGKRSDVPAAPGVAGGGSGSTAGVGAAGAGRPGGDPGGVPARGDGGAGSASASDDAGVRRDGGDGSGDGASAGTEPRSLAGRDSAPDVGGTDDAADVSGEPAPDSADVSKPAKPRGVNHVIAADDVLAPNGDVAKITGNIKAIETLRELAESKAPPTPEQRQALAQYVGWGGIPNVFDRIRSRKYEEWMALSKDAQETRYWMKPTDDVLNWGKKWWKHYEKIKSILTDDEWNAAAASTRWAHYTSRDVITHGLWNAAQRLGFKGGKALENSAGVGHVLGLTPGEIRGRTKWTAVEMDDTSAAILKHLYGAADVRHMGFQNATLANNSFDLVIGNFPFNAQGVSDGAGKQYPAFSLHNFFFAHSLSLIKPGGLIVAITSNSTMDNGASLEFRRWMAEKADLVGAIRLPNNAFKKNAGTEVTTDILMFRKKDGTAFAGQGFVDALEYDTGKPMEDGSPGVLQLNEYFHKNPEMMLGRMALEGSMYGPEQPALVASKEQIEQFTALLDGAVSRLPVNVMGKARTAEGAAERAQVQMAGVRPFSFQESDGVVGQVDETGVLTPIESKADAAKVKRFIDLRQRVLGLLNQQLDPEADAKTIEASRKALNKSYDLFVKNHKPVNASTNRLLQGDPQFSIVGALERIEFIPVEGKGGLITQKAAFEKSDILSKRTQFPRIEPTSASSVEDAAATSIFWRGRIDTDWMATLLGDGASAASVTAGLVDAGLAFRDPQAGILVERDEYLSGDVIDRLNEAKEAAGLDSQFKKNVEALEQVQPKRIPMSKIHGALGARWIDPAVYEAWIAKVLELPPSRARAKVEFVEATRTFAMHWPSYVESWPVSTEKMAAGGISGMEIIHTAMQMKDIQAFDVYYEDGVRKTRVNPERTMAAQAKQRELRDNFSDWLKNSPFVTQIEDAYNAKFNRIVPREWKAPKEESFPGMSAGTSVLEHNRAAIVRGTRESYLNANGVGTGKTYVEIGTAMEWRRLGMAKKPVLVVQKSTVPQIVETFKKVYPNANILFPSERDFEAKNRKSLFAKIATNDYDCIILSHSQFDRIQDDPARIKAFVNQQIAALVDAKDRKAQAEGKNSPGVKQIQAAISGLEAYLKKILARETDDLVNFEQLGIDGLLVDEAHAYKKNFFQTQMGNVKGLDKSFSQRSMSLFLKARFVRDRNAGKNVVLLTGTPVTNTLAEAWNMMRYVRPDVLEESSIPTFDDFAGAFTERVTEVEMDAVGRFRQQTRFTKFKNVRPLQRIWMTVANRVTAEDLGLPRPELEGGAPRTVEVQRSAPLAEVMDDLLQQYEDWEHLPAADKREQSHVPLVIYGTARKAAIDIRLVDPTKADDPDSKANRAVREVLRIYTEGQAGKLTQLVFADRFQSSDGSFNVFEAMRDALVKGGVAKDEIAIIHEHESDAKRKVLFANVNSGKVRILFGTTEKVGVGVNVQERLKALHHLDAPDRPSDIEQREGRILRQGSTVKEAMIIRYGVSQTLDAGAYERLARKQKFINQVLSGRDVGESVEDVADSVPTFQEAAAIFSGDPRVRHKFTLETRYKQLQSLENQHVDALTTTRRRIDEENARAKREQKVADTTAAFLAKHGDLAFARDDLKVTIKGKTTKGKDGVEALEKAITAGFEGIDEGYGPPFVVTVNGLEITCQAHVFTTIAGGSENSMVWKFEDGAIRVNGTGNTGAGMISSLRAQFGNLEGRAETAKANAVALAASAQRRGEFLDRPFEQKAELSKVKGELDVLIGQLEAEDKLRTEARKASDQAKAGILERAAALGEDIADAAAARLASPTPHRKHGGSSRLLSDVADLAIYAAGKSIAAGAKGASAINQIVTDTIKALRPTFIKHFARVRDVTRAILDRSQKEGIASAAEFEKVVKSVKRNPRQARLLFFSGIGEGIVRMKARLPKIRAAIRQAEREKRENIEDIRKVLVEAIKSTLPPSIQGRFLAAVRSNVRTRKALVEALDRVRATAAGYQAKAAWGFIRERVGSKPGKLKVTEARRARLVAIKDEAGIIRKQMLAKGASKDVQQMEAWAGRLADLQNEVTQIFHEHENENVILVEGQMKKADDYRNEVADRLTRTGEIKTSQDIARKVEPTIFRRGGRRLLVPETTAMTFDGEYDLDSKGPSHDLIVKNFWKGETASHGLVQEQFARAEKIAKAAGFTSLGDVMAKISGTLGEANQERVSVPLGGADSLTLGQALDIYAKDDETREREEYQGYNFASRPNAEPFMLDDKDRDAVEAAIPDAYKKFVTLMKATFEDFRPDLFATHRRLKGWEPPVIVGYWPIKLNEKQGEAGAPESSLWKDLMNRHLENAGYLKTREGAGATPMLIGDFMQTWLGHVHSAANIIHMAENVRAAEAVLLHPTIKNEIEKRFGDSAVERVEEIISDGSFANPLPHTKYEKVFLAFTRNISRAKVAINVRSWMKNVAGAVKLMAVMPADAWAAGLAGAMKPGVGKRMIERSPFNWARYHYAPYAMFANIEQGVDGLVGDQASTAIKAMATSLASGKFRDSFHDLTKVFDAVRLSLLADSVGARIAWAGYEYLAKKHGHDVKWVAWEAEKAMRRSQNTASPNDTNGVVAWARRRAFLSPFLTFTSDSTKSLNIYYQAVRSKDAARITKTLFAINLNTALSAAVTGFVGYGLYKLLSQMFGSDDWEEAEKWEKAKERAAWAFLRESLGTVWMADRIAEWVESITTGFNKGERFLTPTTSTVMSLVKAADDAIQAVDRMNQTPEEAKRRQLTAGDLFIRALEKAGMAGLDMSGLSISPTYWLIKGALPKGAESGAEVRATIAAIEKLADAATTEEKTRKSRLEKGLAVIRENQRQIKAGTIDPDDGERFDVEMTDYLMGRRQERPTLPKRAKKAA